jgi:hypothetical protein
MVFFLQHARSEAVTLTQQPQRIQVRYFRVAEELGIEQRQTTNQLSTDPSFALTHSRV